MFFLLKDIVSSVYKVST
uniref:Uncharacterized protein n=1 Tax=Arundo donax TaxID=35708 RepID=A0A0A9GDN9_ARUDO